MNQDGNETMRLLARAAEYLAPFRRRFVVCLVAIACLPAQSSADGPPAETVLNLAESWHIDHSTHHVQGLCVSKDAFWISSVERATKSGWIFRVARASLQVESSRRLTDGPRYHPGGMQLSGTKLWIPLAEYRPHSTSRIVKLNADTLAEEFAFTVDDHIGAVAVDSAGTIYAANWDAEEFYLFDRDGTLKRKVINPTGVAYQDFEWHDGRLLGTGRIGSGRTARGVVDSIDPKGWRHVARYVLAGTSRTGQRNFGREGFCSFAGDFYLLPEDGPNSTVYRFGRSGN